MYFGNRHACASVQYFIAGNGIKVVNPIVDELLIFFVISRVVAIKANL